MTPQINVRAPIAELLAQLNLIRAAKSMPTLKRWSKSRGDLVAAISHTGVTVTRAPPAVANGAYSHNREAQHKTSHTTSGKTASQSKKETRMAKHIEKRTAIDVSAAKNVKRTPTIKPAQKRQATPPGAFSLADWARQRKLSPKIARARARKHVAELKSLQHDKTTKYVYPNKNRSKVDRILGGK